MVQVPYYDNPGGALAVTVELPHAANVTWWIKQTSTLTNVVTTLHISEVTMMSPQLQFGFLELAVGI